MPRPDSSPISSGRRAIVHAPSRNTCFFVFGKEDLDHVRAEHYSVMAENGPVIAAGYRAPPGRAGF